MSIPLPPVRKYVMPCAACRRMLHLGRMVRLTRGRIGCIGCWSAGR